MMNAMMGSTLATAARTCTSTGKGCSESSQKKIYFVGPYNSYNMQRLLYPSPLDEVSTTLSRRNLRVGGEQRGQRCAAEQHADRSRGADDHAQLQQPQHVYAPLAPVVLCSKCMLRDMLQVCII